MPNGSVTCRWLGLVLLALGTLVGGCGVVGFVGSAIFPETVEARYQPPMTPMLILVENQSNPEMVVAEADQLAAMIAEEFTAHEICPVVSLQDLQALRDREEYSEKTITQIGSVLGAQQVLYIDLRRMSIGSEEGVLMRGELDLSVRVVNVSSGKTVYPSAGSLAHEMSFQTPFTTGTIDPDRTRDELVRRAAVAVAQLFYTYKL